MTPNVRVVPAALFGEAATTALLELIQGIASPLVGLPTGNTPGPLFEALRRSVEAGSIDISRWRPVAIDEYGGPARNPCSNRSYFESHWDTIPGAPPVAQFDPGAGDLDAECRRMADLVKSQGGLDVAVLGIGMNGHLAFNEPGSAPDSNARRVELHSASIESARACWGAEAPDWGLTLGLGELLGARAVLVLAKGEAKARIVHAALTGPVSSDLPASLVRQAPNHLFVLDEAAASELATR